MNSGSKTSSVARPHSNGRPATDSARTSRTSSSGPSGRSGRDQSVLGDLTRPIRADRPLVTGRSKRWALALLGLGVIAALLVALFSLPVKTWFRQQDEIAAKQQNLDVLTAANDQLTREVERLQTEQGTQEAARAQLGLVTPGEQRISVLAPTDGILPLPKGWPYDAVSQIIAVRAAGTPAPTDGPLDNPPATMPVTSQP